MKVESVEIERTDNGAFIVRCNKRPADTTSNDLGGYQSKKTAYETLEEAWQYVAREFGEGSPERAEPRPAAMAAPGRTPGYV